MSAPCSSCNGRGQVITDPCTTCKGAGRIKQKQNVKIKGPAGIDNGMRLRMAGYGDAEKMGGKMETYLSLSKLNLIRFLLDKTIISMSSSR